MADKSKPDDLILRLRRARSATKGRRRRRSPAEHYAALRRDFAALEELCVWQWNLIHQMRSHLDRMPARWPGTSTPS